MLLQNCSYCRSTGKDPNSGALSGYRPCPVCKGHRERIIDVFSDQLKDCSYCNGTGRDPNSGSLHGYRTCPVCEGWGSTVTPMVKYSKSKKEKTSNSREISTDLISSAEFLGLDQKWASSTCALQLQEIAVTLVAKKKGIELDKQGVQKIYQKKIDKNSFNLQYDAFSKEVKRMYGIEMPILTTHFRRIRVNVLHQGYNPKEEEKESIVSFTIGLLNKLKMVWESEQIFKSN